MTTLSYIVPGIWFILTAAFILCGWGLVSILPTVVVTGGILIYTFEKKAYRKEQGYCLFGGIIISACLGMYLSGETDLLGAILGSGFVSMPLLASDEKYRHKFSEAFKNFKDSTPSFSSAVSSKLDNAFDGCFTIIIFWIAIFIITMIIGLVCTIIQYVKSVYTLLSAGMEENVPSVTEYLNNLNSNSANEEQKQNDQDHWL